MFRDTILNPKPSTLNPKPLKALLRRRDLGYRFRTVAHRSRSRGLGFKASELRPFEQQHKGLFFQGQAEGPKDVPNASVQSNKFEKCLNTRALTIRIRFWGILYYITTTQRVHIHYYYGIRP